MGNISCLYGKSFISVPGSSGSRGEERLGGAGCQRAPREEWETEIEWKAGSGREMAEKTEQWGLWPGFRVKCVGQGSQRVEGEP